MNHGGSGKGPWVMADLEKGLWGANVTRSNEPPLEAAYVTVMLKGGANLFALKGGDAQAQAPPGAHPVLADDLALISTSEAGLQALLDSWSSYAPWCRASSWTTSCHRGIGRG